MVGVLAVLVLLGGVVVVVIRHDTSAAGPAAPASTRPAVQPTPDGWYCYGCFYTAKISAFRSRLETQGYSCQAGAEPIECRKGDNHVVTFHPSAQQPTRLGGLTVRTTTTGPADRRQGNALSVAATNADLRLLLAGIFADPAIHDAVIQHYTWALEDCDPPSVVVTGFKLGCTKPIPSTATAAGTTWSSSVTIERAHQ